ncbi:MAG: substrate-binding domain-containing protein [Luteolibacter sp.]
MAKVKIFSAVEQVAGHVKKGLVAGYWRGEMPGVVALAGELGVNHKTVEAALSQLEREGVLVGQGARRPRRVGSFNELAGPSLRIGLVLHEAADLRTELTLEIRHALQESGHVPFVAKRNIAELGSDIAKVSALLARQPADAWVVYAAPFEVLEWFSKGELPAFAVFGRFRRLPIAAAAPDKTGAYVAAVNSLVRLGHRRIVLLARPQHRQPVPSRALQTFLDALTREGIQVSDYHNPHWENTCEGFQKCLESLFRSTPPSALIVQESVLLGAVQQFLQARGIRVPRDVSLVCTDPDPTFAWRVPTVAHIRWDTGPVIRRIARWANQVALGKKDRQQLLSKAEFVPGGTIGPVAAKFRGL